MVTMAQSATNCRNTHTHVDHIHSLTHLHQHSYNHFVQSTSSVITEFGIKFYLMKVAEGGEQTGVPGETKNPTTSSLIGITY